MVLLLRLTDMSRIDIEGRTLMTLLKRNTRFFVLVGVLLLVGLAIACTNDDAPRSQSTPVSTDGVIPSGTTSEITPTQTSATEPDSVPAVVSTPNSPTEIVSGTTEKNLAQPLQPVIRLHYGGQVYDGVPGNFCWPSITTSVQGGMWGDARMAARRLAWERLARSLLSCVSSSHRSNSVGPNRSRGSISRTTR